MILTNKYVLAISHKGPPCNARGSSHTPPNHNERTQFQGAVIFCLGLVTRWIWVGYLLTCMHPTSDYLTSYPPQPYWFSSWLIFNTFFYVRNALYDYRCKTIMIRVQDKTE